MNQIEFIPLIREMEFELADYFIANYKFSNVIMSRTELLNFQFPAFLQGENFYLERLLINVATHDYTWDAAILLDNIYRQSGNFATYTFPTPLTIGYYRIRAGSYTSFNLLESKLINQTTFDEASFFVNDVFDTFNNNLGSPLAEPLNV